MPTVVLKDDRQTPKDIEFALRKLKKSVERGGVLKKLHEKQGYEKPTTKRARKHAAAVMRWRRDLSKQKLPEKMY